MLYARLHPATTPHPDQPLLVFLHGLMGKGDDWQALTSELSEFNHLLIDLPCHGNSQTVKPQDFSHTCQLIEATITAHTAPNIPIVMIGYSLGGRLAMYGAAKQIFAPLNIIGYFIEGGHFGLRDGQEQEARLRSDLQWAMRFRNEPIEQVLSDWYKQAVFSSLNGKQVQEMIAKRAHNLGSAIAEMLLATSLAKQPFLLKEILECSKTIHYLCGEKDQKFLSMARESRLPFTVIEKAGHNAHHEQALTYANIIRHQIATL